MRLGLGLSMSATDRGNRGVAVNPVVYKLIDGNFFRELCLQYSSEVEFDLWKNLDWDHISQKQRTFFYDSLPAQKPSQTIEEFNAFFDSRSAELDRLSRIPNVFVKNGASRFRKKIGLQQKGVDILLATDAILFAHRGVADELHIYANDLDFFPVFEALQSTSCRGRLFYNPELPPTELIPYADSAEPIRINFLFEACSIGWGSARSIYTSDSPSCSDEPFIDAQSTHGDTFQIRFDQSTGSFEVRYWVNSRLECFTTQKPVLAYGIAEKFMRVLPSDLLQTLRSKKQ